MKTAFQPSTTIDRRLLAAFVAVSAVLLVGLAALVCACGGTEAAATTTTVSTQTVNTTAAVTTTQSVTTSEAATTTTTEETLEIRTEIGIPYVTRSEELGPALIHVWAPEKPGPWPVVVMVHGGNKPISPGGVLPLQPLKVAQRGAVVFAPVWWRDVGIDPGQVADETDAKECRGDFLETIGEIAAAVRFARASAARYGGDPDNVTLFGFSGGANYVVPVAVGGAPPSEGALAGEGSSVPESLAILDPDYLHADPVWARLMAVDPSFMSVGSPFSYVGHSVNFPITVICSGDPGLSRELGDPWAEDSWLAVRDPSGDIRRGLKELGALSGDTYTNESAGQLFAEWLKADGDAVTYIRLTASTHNSVGPEDLETVLEALVPKAQP